jgi:hypothetical protein
MTMPIPNLNLNVPQNALSEAVGPTLNMNITTGAFALGKASASNTLEPLNETITKNGGGSSILIFGMVSIIGILVLNVATRG